MMVELDSSEPSDVERILDHVQSDFVCFRLGVTDVPLPTAVSSELTAPTS